MNYIEAREANLVMFAVNNHHPTLINKVRVTEEYQLNFVSDGYIKAALGALSRNSQINEPYRAQARAILEREWPNEYMSAKSNI